jgi:hypothetical protein
MNVPSFERVLCSSIIVALFFQNYTKKRGRGENSPLPIVNGLPGTMVLTLGQTTNSLMFLQIPCFFTVVPVLCISVSGAGGTYCRLSWICFFVLSVFPDFLLGSVLFVRITRMEYCTSSMPSGQCHQKTTGSEYPLILPLSFH